MKKTLLKIALGLVAAFVLVVGATIGPAFWGNAANEDGAVFGDGRVITVTDGYVNCFLVRPASEGEPWLMIDACMDASGAAVAAALAKHKATPDDVGLILLTHGHLDHTQGAAAFKNAKVRALAAELPLLKGEVAAKSPMGTLTGAKDTGVRVEEPLRDGGSVSFAGTRVDVFAVPGHTGGSAVFLAHGTLFFGDSANGRDDGGMKSAPWLFSDDTAQNKRSLVALYNRLSSRAGDVKHLAFGHSGALEGFSALKAFTP